MSRSWTFKIYRSWDEVDDPPFLAQWEGWMEASPDTHVFNHPAMVKAWTDTYRSLQHISPLYVVGETEGVTAFMPLVLWRRNWKNAFVRLLVPAGYSDYDYHDPVFTFSGGSGGLLDSFWTTLEKRLLSDSSIVFDEADISGFRIRPSGNAWLESGDVCPVSDLGRYADYEDFLSALKRSMRHNLQKKMRRLEEQGRLEYRVYDKNEVSEALSSLPAFLEAHSQRWPNAYKAPGLHEAILSHGIAAGIVHFSELRLDGKVIDWDLGFHYKRRFYYYMSTSPYNDAYVKYSPGRIHLSHLIRDCFTMNVDTFDFLRGDHGYKEEWPTEKMTLYGFSYASGKPGSGLRLGLRELLNRLKR